VVSRGVIEGQCKREEFGMERTEAVLKQSEGASAKEIAKLVLDDVQQFMCTAPTHNDVTALALVRSRAGAVPPS